MCFDSIYSNLSNVKVIKTNIDPKINIGLQKTSIFQKLSYLSIDVVIGSVACEMLVTKLLNSYPGPAWWIILPVSVWIIYAIDRQIDAYKQKIFGPFSRYSFQHHYAKNIILVIFSLAIIILLLVLFFLEKQILYFGFGMGFFTFLYLLFVYFSGKQTGFYKTKKLLIALIYTLGIWGGPMALINYRISESQWIAVGVFFMLAFLDTLLLTLYDEDSVHSSNQISRLKRFGQRITGFIVIPFLVVILILYFSFPNGLKEAGPWILGASLIYLLMAASLALLFGFPDFFIKYDRYRIFPELVFWLPALSMIL